MKEYIYDDSFDGLLTTIFYAYPSKEAITITRQSMYQPNLLHTPISIPTEIDKANRVATSIQQKLGSDIFRQVYYLYLCELLGCEKLILDYLHLCYKFGASITLAKHHDTIIEVDTLCRKVSHESHRMNGFVRFKEVAPMCYYATIEPDHHVLPLLSGHFTRRFSDQSFVIHDLKRHIALIYNEKEAYLQELTPEESLSLSSTHIKDGFEELFQAFYASTTIASRLNPKLQKRLMPVRYWKHLVEV